MNDLIKADLFRLYGDSSSQTFRKAKKDFRFMYMYYWRIVTDKNSNALSRYWSKFRLKSLRKHYHIEIPYTVQIGKGFSMDHAYNITVNSKAVIGENVSMYKGSTIGLDASGVPTIGSNVYIGINSTIVGGVTIGSNVLIAPNSFVNFSVPDNSVVLGNPGTIHHKDTATKAYLLNVIQ